MDSVVRNLVKLQELDTNLETSKKNPTPSQIQTRKKLVDSLPSYVGSTYEKIRGSRDPAAVPCSDGYCEACQMQVPPYLANRVEYNHEVEVCEHCGRLLYAKESLELAASAA